MRPRLLLLVSMEFSAALAQVVTTVAGQTGEDGLMDGVGTNVLFYNPQGIAVNGAGSVAYIVRELELY
jgi:hypothetical protein